MASNGISDSSKAPTELQKVYTIMYYSYMHAEHSN